MAWVDPAAWLDDRERRGLRRRLRLCDAAGGAFVEDGRRRVNFSSNDYLDLARDPRVVEGAHAAARCWGAGAGASRLMSGTLPCHAELEAALARMKGYPSALVYGSGYATNLGVLDAWVRRGDVVLADRLAHASLLDGARLAGARLRRYRHNDLDHLRVLLSGAPRPRLVVTEAVFSMDGDTAPMAETAALCEAAGVPLLVDEAHATGVLGPAGVGAVRGAGQESRVTFCMGTLGKALGSFGGFVACAPVLREYLVNASRSFIYATALPPPCVGAALAALRVLAAEPDRPVRLAERARLFRTLLNEAGFDVGSLASPIIPLRIGSDLNALRWARALEEEDVLAVSVRPPTVPPGTSRLRFSVTLAHTDADFAAAVSALVRVRERLQ